MASGIDERTLKREGVCAASLPTTMVIFNHLTNAAEENFDILTSCNIAANAFVF